MNVIFPSIAMRLKPDQDECLETECLFGEKIEIIDSYKEWFFCKLLTDKYAGWVTKKSLGIFKTATHRVITIRSFIYTEKNIKSNVLHYIPLGSLLHVINLDNEWATILLSKEQNYNPAYVPRKDIIKVNKQIKDWVTIGEMLKNTPYKWGGRDSTGIDCSALVQLSYQAFGQNIPRNSVDQVKLKKESITNLNNLERGFVVFWEAHVGIMINNYECLHANAHHMKTVVEPLKDIITRIGKKHKLVKILNFNS